ncbi:MAG TPA: YihY/virulence factor BrkB family protein [Gemmatimonadaceae bacterium]|nr:YihY/virulence factor BrkB family protein [Gemmatimonadaceae bacterium]
MPLTTAPLPARLWAGAKDYARRIWDNSAEDDIFFLTSAVAFNILLAAVPLVLLLLSALGYWLNHTAAQSRADLWNFIEALLPPHAESADSPYHRVIDEIIRTRRSVGVISAVAFVWFTTRLFGSLRSALGSVFDVRVPQGILAGKAYDVLLTFVAGALFIAWTGLSAYLRLATKSGVQALSQLGVHPQTMGFVEYALASLTASAALALMFFALYKFLPNRPVRWDSAAVGAVVTTLLLELAKMLFGRYAPALMPSGLYAGTLYAVVVVVFWVYYAALIFLLGGEVGQAYEHRRAVRLQRETFED